MDNAYEELQISCQDYVKNNKELLSLQSEITALELVLSEKTKTERFLLNRQEQIEEQINLILRRFDDDKIAKEIVSKAIAEIAMNNNFEDDDIAEGV